MDTLTAPAGAPTVRRCVTDGDVVAAKLLDDMCFPEHKHVGWDTYAAIHERGVTMVAEAGDEPVAQGQAAAAAAVTEDGPQVLSRLPARHGMLTGGSVRPDWRGRGLHRNLVRARLRYLQLHGCAYAMTHVRVENVASVTNLLAVGFVATTVDHAAYGPESDLRSHRLVTVAALDHHLSDDQPTAPFVDADGPSVAVRVRHHRDVDHEARDVIERMMARGWVAHATRPSPEYGTYDLVLAPLVNNHAAANLTDATRELEQAAA